MLPYQRSLPGSSQIKQYGYFSPQALSISQRYIIIFQSIFTILHIYQFMTPPHVKQDSFWAQELCLFCLFIAVSRTQKNAAPIKCLIKMCLINEWPNSLFCQQTHIDYCLALFQLLGNQIGIQYGLCLQVGELDMQKLFITWCDYY